jgi:acid phosphatase type 7
VLRTLPGLLLLLLACKKDAVVTAPSDAAQAVVPQHEALDVDAGPVTIAAAGDISEAEVGHQVETANLVADGGYDGVLLLGDDQYPAGRLEDYTKYFAPTWGRFMEKLHPTPGNHEYVTPGGAGYFAYFGTRAGDPTRGYYSYDLGAWHLIALNTNNACRAIACDAQSEQLKWLRADLEAHRNRCTLAYFHHPRFCSGQHHGDFAGASAIWDVLYEYGTDVVLNGHEHLYERFDPQDPSGRPDEKRGIRELVIGTGGAENYPLAATKPNSAVRHTGAFGILKMTLKPGAYDWEFVPVRSGELADTGSGVCH